VYAFEALPYYSKVLSSTMKLLHVRNVTVINRAVSDKEGNIDLVWQDGSGQMLTGFTHVEGTGEAQGSRVSVPTVSLDSLVSGGDFDGKRVAFIKCDVEGYECHVVDGARRLIEKWKPVIFAEAKDDWFRRYGKSSKDLIRAMEFHVYSANIFRPDGSLQQVTAGSYSGAGDILFRPA
jgi:FkbM family methyltransferase